MYKLKKVLSVMMVFVLITTFLLQMTVLAEETAETQSVQKEESTEVQTKSEETADNQASAEASSDTDAQDKAGEAGEETPEETKAPEASETSDGAEDPEDEGTPDGTEDPEDEGTSDGTEDPEDEGTPDETEDPEDEGASDETEDMDETEMSDGTEDPEETEMSDGTEDPEETEMSDETEDPEETEIESSKETEMSEETEMSGTEETGEAEETEEEKQSEDSDSEEDIEETETEEPAETEEETAEEETAEEETEAAFTVIQGVVLALEEYSEEELKALSLPVILSRLQDSEGNSLEIPPDALTVWILIKDEKGTPVFDKKYDIDSEETLDLSPFVNQPGYVLELTVGNGEKQDPGNIQYVAEIKGGDMLELGETDDAMPTSLLPLEEVRARLYVNPYEEETIKSASIKWILKNLRDYDGNKIDVPQDVSVVWYRFKMKEIEGTEYQYQYVVEDDYKAVSLKKTIDLTPFAFHYETLELIAGSGKQLDDGNVRYIVDVKAKKLENIDVSCQVYAQRADGTREELKQSGTYETEAGNDSVKVMRFVDMNRSEGDTYYMGVTPSADNSENPCWEAAVYNHSGLTKFLSGKLNTPAITDQVLDQDLTGEDTGYKKKFGDYQNDYFGLVYKNPDTGKVYEKKLFGVEVLGDSCSISPYLYEAEENGGKTEIYDNDKSVNDDPMVLERVKNKGVINISYSLENYRLASSPYNFAFHIESESGETDSSTVKKAVVGLYNSLKAAAGQKDIKDQLISYGETDVSGYQADYSRANGGQDFTLFFKDGGKAKYHVEIPRAYYGDMNLYLMTDKNGEKRNVSSNNGYIDGSNRSAPEQEGVYGSTITLNPGYSMKDKLYLVFSSDEMSSRKFVERIVVGQYNSLEEADGQTNIKNQALKVSGGEEPAGYKITNYDTEDGIYFTLFYEDGTYIIERVRIELTDIDAIDEPVVGKPDPWLRITGAKQNDEDLDIYVVQNGYRGDKTLSLDTTYGYGYFTVFVNNTADLKKVVPEFWVPDEDSVRLYYAQEDGSPGSRVETGVTEVDFSKGPVQFILVVQRGKLYARKNYVIEFKNKAEGARLYVSGPKKREVFLDEYHEYKHDILIANLGQQDLTGLTVKLDADNCKLDDYWTVGGKKNNTLKPFTTAKRGLREEPTDEELREYFNNNSGGVQTDYGELPNLAKISLLPDGDGDISGTLTISADDQKPIVIELTGHAQNPKITTEKLTDAVKYVPYSCIITTNNMHDWIDVKYSLKGDLPDGVRWIQETGEIYGVPREEGNFPVSITATFSASKTSFTPSTVEFTLKVNPNTDGNVYNASDENYTIMDPVGEDAGGHNFVLKETGDQVFRSSGALGEFQDLWLNGQKLTPGEDYVAEEGSTRITILSQTFEDKVIKDAANTLAAEFRVGGEKTNELKRTAQNFRLEIDPATETESETESETEPATKPEPTTETESAAKPETKPSTEPATEKETTNTSTTGNTVTCVIALVDENGSPLTSRSLELHSTPVTATTDASGLANFSQVEFGNHTLYLKDSNGGTSATKDFVLQRGSASSQQGDTIVAAAGSTVTVTMTYADNALTIDSVKNGTSAPQTGDDTPVAFWLTLLLISCGVLVVAGRRRRTSR